MAYDLSIIDRYTLQYRRVGTTIIVDVVDTLANNTVESTTFINAVPGAPIPNEITSFGRGRITALMADATSSSITSITNADAYAAQFVGKFVRSKQYRTFTGSAAERRLAFYQKKRVLAIVRNLSATETIRIGTTAVGNGNRNPPAYADGVYGTDSPKSKYMLIPPLQAFITTYDPSQIWSKSTANNNHLCIELWSTP